MIVPLTNRKPKIKFHLTVHLAIEEVPATDWNEIVAGKNIYLSIDYLRAIESSLPSEISFRYLLFYEENLKPVSVAVVASILFIDKGLEDNQAPCAVRNKIKSRFIKSSGIKILTCGSPFASGENGFAFSDRISPEIAYENLCTALIQLQKTDFKSLETNVLLLKEFWPESFNSANVLNHSGFTDFMIDVNMVMQIPLEWKSKHDYLAAMVTKFRTKAKSAYHKSEDLIIVNFQDHEIEYYKNEIFELYLEVLQKSPFRFGVLNADSFVEMKKNLRDSFMVKGYFLKNELVGFSSAFVFDSILDANFVGINYELNQEFAIYQRMLYDYIELAINRNCREVRFGRTAEEIKSSVGAKPVNMKLYIRHKNMIPNQILRSIIGSTKPSLFELRKPFKV